MNLLERVQAALDDTKLRIVPNFFEDCATDLLSSIYPNLVPIPGGSDSGRDADVLNPTGSPPTRVAITSSRTYEGARRNLLASIASLKSHRLSGSSILSVSLAELNQSKRLKLERVAEAEGYDLVSVIDRSFFAQRLGVNGEWRSKLLRLPGGPFSLSRVSGYAVKSRQSGGLIGRDLLVEMLSNATQDLIVWGPPGVGKSAAVEESGALFVEGEPSAERLQDDILAMNATLIVVDDAARRPQTLDLLLHIRKQEALSYLIVAVVWPHERESIASQLTGAREVEVELLARREIAEIVKSYGITSIVTLTQILDQARGRAGWAIRLAELLKKGTEWKRVYSGEALKGEVKTYLSRSGVHKDALQVLSVIGLLGSITESDLGRLARQLNVPRTRLARTINDIAVGGLLDVVRRNSADGIENEYSIAPEVLATSIVAEAFFAEALPPLTVREVYEEWPDRRLSIVTTVIRVVLLGFEHAVQLATSLFADVVEVREIPGDRSQLLHHYLHMGDGQAQEVLRLVLSPLLSGGREGSGADLRSRAMDASSFFAEAIGNVRLYSAVEDVLQVASLLERGGESPERFLKEVVDGIRGFGPAQRIDLTALATSWARAIKRYGESIPRSVDTPLLYLLRESMRPSFDANWMSPEGERTVQMVSATLLAADMRFLMNEMWEPFERLDPCLSRAQLSILVDLVSDWARLANGQSLSFGGRPTTTQANEAKLVAQRIANWVVARSGQYPGLRAALRGHLRGKVLEMPDEKEELLAVFFDTREPGEDWQSWMAAQRERIFNLLVASGLSDRPEELCARLGSLKVEFESVRSFAFVDPIVETFRALDETDQIDRALYFRLASRHGLLREASVLIYRYVEQPHFDAEILAELMTEARCRSVLIDVGLRAGSESRIFSIVFAALVGSDASEIQFALHRNADPRVVSVLLDHPVVRVRAATAVAVLASQSNDYPIDLDSVAELWQDALRQIQSPLGFVPVFGESDFFEAMLAYAPGVFEDLLTDVVSQPVADFSWEALHCFDESAPRLSAEAKSRIWTSVSAGSWRPTVLRTLAGNDLEWIGSLIRADHVSPQQALYALTSMGSSASLEELARLFVPLGIAPTEIARTLQFGSFTGERDEVIAGHLASLGILEASTDPSARLVGNAGREYFTPRYQEALKEARRKEVAGEL